MGGGNSNMAEADGPSTFNLEQALLDHSFDHQQRNCHNDTTATLDGPRAIGVPLPEGSLAPRAHPGDQHDGQAAGHSQEANQVLDFSLTFS